MSSTSAETWKNNVELNVRNLSEAELEIVVQVIQRDFELKAAEKARIRRHKRQLKDADERITVLATSDFNKSFCIICFRRFWPLIIPKRCCYSCQHYMCRKCSCFIKQIGVYICMLCQKERSLKSMGCDWYYGLVRNRFHQEASELVAQTLFTDKGQYNVFMEIADQLMSPNLLQKVKGAQISQYRERIEAKWEELEERLRVLELSEINLVKRQSAYKFLKDEYRIKFREVLKDFSQVLYVTLENFAAKLEEEYINVNEQVVTTVHEEVEQLIGYKVNCVPEEAGSVVSEVDSVVSGFNTHHIEEKLAIALVEKIFSNHNNNVMENYDINFLDEIPLEDQSSTATYLFQSRPPRKGPASDQSSVMTHSSSQVTNDHIEITETLASEYKSPSDKYYSSNESNSTIDGDLRGLSPAMVNGSSGGRDDMGVSQRQVQHCMRYSPATTVEVNERHISVPRGEPVNLLLELSGVRDIEVQWIKEEYSSHQQLQTNNSIEIVTLASEDGQAAVTSSLKIWDSKLSDSGLYIAVITGKPIARFNVKIIDNEKIPEMPHFRLGMLKTTTKVGQNSEFTVEVGGYPEPRVRFYHNSRLLESDRSTKYIIDRQVYINRHTLRITKISEGDGGIYKCKASNFGGSAESSALLNVISRQFRFENNETQTHRGGSSSASSGEGSVKMSLSPRFPTASNNTASSSGHAFQRPVPSHSPSSTEDPMSPQPPQHSKNFAASFMESPTASLNQTRDRLTSTSDSEKDSQIFAPRPLASTTVIAHEMANEYKGAAAAPPPPLLMTTSVSRQSSLLSHDDDIDSDISRIVCAVPINNNNTSVTGGGAFGRPEDTDSELSWMAHREDEENNLDGDSPDIARRSALNFARSHGDQMGRHRVLELKKQFESGDPHVQSYTKKVSITQRTPAPNVNPRRGQSLTKEVRIRSDNSFNE